MYSKKIIPFLSVTLISAVAFVSCSKNKEADWKCACPAVPPANSSGLYYAAETFRYEYVTKSVAKSRCNEETKERQRLDPSVECDLSKL